MTDLAPVFNGERVALMSIDPVWFVVRVTEGLNAGIRLVHLDPPSQLWAPLAQGIGSMAVHIDHAVESLHGDSIGWIIQCESNSAVNLPVFVQLFQGTDAAGFRPITRVVRYDVGLTAGESRMINDAVQIQ
jgi:hypothetical protein